MKAFRVACNYTEHFTMKVYAETEEAALQKAEEYMADSGLPEHNIDCFDREYMAVECEEIL